MARPDTAHDDLVKSAPVHRPAAGAAGHAPVPAGAQATCELRVDRAVYLIDESARTYRYLRRNSDWPDLDPAENARNKRHLTGYTRLFPGGGRRVFPGRPPYTRPDQAGRPRAAGRAPTGEPQELADLRRAVDSFAAMAVTLGPHAVVPSGWTAHETLCHLVYWHEHYARVLRAELAGATPALPTGTFADLNAAAVSQLRGQPANLLARRLLAAQTRLEKLAADPRTRHVSIRIKQGSKPWPWPEFVRRVAAHIRGHQGDLRRRLRAAART